MDVPILRLQFADMRDVLGISIANFPAPEQPRASFVLKQHELRRLLNFAGWTIDDVVQNPIARRDVRNWYKLHRATQRRLDVLELEQHWNGIR